MFASSEVGNLQIKLIDLGLSRELGGSNKVCGNKTKLFCPPPSAHPLQNSWDL